MLSRAAGVSPQSFYLHFPDVDALLYEVYAREWAELRGVLADAAAEGRDHPDRLRRVAHAFCDFALESPTRYIALMGMRGQYAPEWTSRELPAIAVFKLVAALIGAGLGHPGGTDLTEAQRQEVTDRAVGLISALHGLVSLKINKPLYPWPLPRLIDQAAVHSLQTHDWDETGTQAPA
jgi:AcrR family transcriptional regulator